MKDGPLLKWCEEDNEGNIWSEPVYDDGTGESVIQYGLLNIDSEVVDGEIGLFYINPDDEYTIISEISIGLSVKYAKQACEDHARAELEKLAHYFEPVTCKDCSFGVYYEKCKDIPYTCPYSACRTTVDHFCGFAKRREQ